MQILRKKLTIKVMAFSMLIIFLQSLFIPTASYALTHGLHQPEYTSYEEPGATDMVNLLTGDFSTSFPIVEVPGPEGGFSLPLSYHAGIGLEQEASWVGLGWSLNPGAITRNIVEYPDDAKGNDLSVTLQDPNVGRGWTSSLLGLGLGEIGWDSNVGHYGSVNLFNLIALGYDDGGINSVGAVGVHFSGSGVSIRPHETFLAATFLATVGNAYAIANETASGLAKVALGPIFAKQAGVGLAFSGIASLALGGSSTPNYADGAWPITKRTEQRLFHKNYWHFIDATRTENMYGSLYLGKQPTPASVSDLPQDNPNPRLGQSYPNLDDPALYVSPNDNLQGTGSDMYSPYDGNNYVNFNYINHTSIAKDLYNVSGLGLSGTIEPYRLDVGSLAFPRSMTSDHARIALVPFVDYKVPFVYKGAHSNAYYQQIGMDSGGNIDINNPQLGAGHGALNTQFNPDKAFWYSLEDDVLTNSRIESNRFGLKDRRLALQKHIEWYTNNEIRTQTTTNQQPYDFIDFNPPTQSASFRSGLPADGIGGFKIIREDGMRFYYALPVYSKNFSSRVEDINNPNKNFEIKRDDPYATTWLLTAIAGADYVDRNNNGTFDDQDWGYWVKFEYGKFGDNYIWRTPYIGKKITSEGTQVSFSQGVKETYYLDEIKTRSHTAIFFKSQRNDGKGYPHTTNMGSESSSASSLKLDNIYILKNSDYESLTQSGTGLVILSKQNFSTDNFQLGFGDSYDGVWDSFDAIRNNAISSIRQNAVKRISFNYSNDLCLKTPNSFSNARNPPVTNQAQWLGKLSLNSISIMGRNNFKVMPDYNFEYGFNPDYDKDKWDGWGYYNRNGTSSSTTHEASPIDEDGAAWSLNRIITPLGSEVEVLYERDRYASVSGYDILGNSINYTLNGGELPITEWNKIPLTNPSLFNVGERILVSGELIYRCDVEGPTNQQIDFNGNYEVTEVGSNYIRVGGNYMGIFCSSSVISVLIGSGTVTKIPQQVKGGNIRVSSIISRDENGNEYKTNYLYDKDNGSSSGVVSREPDFIVNYDEQQIREFFDIPFTPVLYGEVSVLNGRLTNNSDFISKQKYEFTTPHHTMVTVQEDEFSEKVLSYGNVVRLIEEWLAKIKFTVDVKTAKIGQPISIKTFDKNDALVASTTFHYTEQLPDNQGFYTEGSILSETLKLDRGGGRGYDNYHRFFRTIKKYHPSVLEKTITTKDRMTTVSENKKWDFISGNVLEMEATNPFGLKTLTETVPAYHQYPEMGPLTENPLQNRHRLSQVAATYTYKLNDSGTKVGLISAGAQTWKKDWNNYREESSSGYVDGATGPQIWRKHESYVWRGKPQNIQDDGTYYFFGGIGTPDEREDFREYNFSSASNPGWLNTGTIARYDHFSMPVETKDNQGRYGITKMGYNEQLKIVEAGNARYNEITFSGAEDLLSNDYFGGEVKKQDGIIGHKVGDNYQVHSGNWSVKLTATGRTFVFKSAVLQPGRKYRSMVWTTATNGSIQYKINGGATQTINVNSMLRSGDWYLVDGIIDAGVGGNIEIWCQGTGSTVYYDDFRFQPLDVGSSAYIYNDRDELEYVLDNNNFYTRYAYDDAGRSVASYVEILNDNPAENEKILQENEYNYAKD